MFPYAVMLPLPARSIASHRLGSSASTANDPPELTKSVATARAETGKAAMSMIAPKIDGRFEPMSTSM